MSQSKEEKIKSCFIELKKLIENQNFSKIIKVSNKILNEDDSDVKAWKCKITAQIHMGDFAGCLKSLKSCKVNKSLLFEKAYCEYRLNYIEDAWNTISDFPADSPSHIRELQSQILYRMERYEECFSKYRELVKSTSDHLDQERLTNLAAVCANRVLAGSKECGPAFGSDASYEQLYNKACELLFSGRVEEALAELRIVENLCAESLTKDGISAEEIADEVAIVRVQQAHCLQRLGKVKEALSIYNSVLKHKPDDAGLVAIINNNIVVINRDANVFDSKKKIKIASAPSVAHKLTSRQIDSIALNQYLLLYITNKDATLSDYAKIVSEHPNVILPMTLLKAAHLKRAKKTDEAVKLLLEFAAKRPEYDLVSKLTATQILLEQQMYARAIEVLMSLEDKHKYSNGVVSSLLVLCFASNQKDLASSVISEAMAWHTKMRTGAAEQKAFLRRAARYHSRNGNPRAGAKALEALRGLDPSNRRVLARLISTYSQFDPGMAEKLSRELPAAEVDPSIDVSSLESSFGAATKYAPRRAKTGADATPKSPTPRGKTKKASELKQKKKKKIRLPKNCVPGQEPDPERWLPRWQRKGPKKRRDRRFKDKDSDVTKGTQGVSSESADKYDITKTSTIPKGSRPNLPSPHVEMGSKWKMQKRKGRNKKH